MPPNMAGREALLAVLCGGDSGAGGVTPGVCDLCRNVTWEDVLAGGAPGAP